MSAVLDAIEDFVSDVWDFLEDVVNGIWDVIVEPILGAVFAIFGIVDETVVTVQRISSPLFATNTDDVYEAGIGRAIIKKIKTDTSFFPNYMEEIYRTKGQIRAYYRYGELDLYVNGLPELLIKGAVVDFDDVQVALDAIFGSTHTVLSASSHFPTSTEYFRWEMQDSPEFYEPWTNTLTHTDVYGAIRTGWAVGTITYNAGPDNYSIAVSRTMELAEFLIEGPGQITEGDTATFTIRSNRIVPVGETIGIDLTYTGTAVDGVDYTEVASTTMLASTDEITVDIVTAETANANRTFAITIDAIDNTGGVFEAVAINAQDTVNCIITDDDALVLTMNDVVVNEANTTITVNVKLNQAAPSGAFSIDYNFTDLGSITGGVDYDNTTGTLNFAGTLDEVQTIDIDIYADVADDDREQFEVFLENSTDVDSIITSAVATVTIVDRTNDPAQGTTVLNEVITKASFTPVDSLIVSYSDDAEPPGQFHYWHYDHADLTYDLLPTTQTISGLEMLPLAILRKNKTNIDVSPGVGSETYLTTRSLMLRVGFQIDDFLDNFAANPDIDLVDDAYLNYSVSPNTVNPVVSKILWLQWYQIVVTSGLSSNIGEYTATILEGDINNAIVWTQHTYSQSIAGVVTTTGDYTHSVSATTTLTIQYQRTDTVYDEIVINNINGMYAINYQTYHEVALSNLSSEEFTIPLSWEIFRQLTAREQMEVYQYIARVDFNAIDITHLEWYETEAFLDLFEFALIVISVVLTAFSFGADGGSWLTGAAAIIESLVVNYAIGELIVFIAELTGNDVLAAVAGVVAAIYLTKPELLSTETLLDAKVLVDLTTDFADNLMLIENIEYQKLAAELQETAAEAKAKLEKEEANRPNAKAVVLDSNFLASIQSLDTSNFPAIQGQYEYDSVFNYDSLVSDFYGNRLQTGVT
jgi:hypothetical protein